MRILSPVRPVATLATFACLIIAPAAQAQFLGTQVTGSLQFGGIGPNLYNPANFLVPNGFLNKTQGTTVTVAQPAIEFGYADFVNLDTVNISANTVTLTNVSLGAGAPFVVKLTDAAFAGLAFTKVSDTFLNGGVTYSLTGNTLSLSAPGFTGAGIHAAVFSVAPVPEPGSAAMLTGIAASGVGFLLRRRRSLGRTV